MQKSTTQAIKEDIKYFQSAIGSLMYAMLETRPDIAYAVAKLSQFASNPNDIHLKALKHLFRYIKGTLHYGLHYSKSNVPNIGSRMGMWAIWACGPYGHVGHKPYFLRCCP